MKLLSSCRKELTILYRDRAGLALLFIMPMALVLVITLIQNNILEETKRSKIRVLVINQDQDDLGYAIEKGLNDSDFFEIQKTIQGSLLTENSLRRAIAGGDFQLGLIIQPGATRAFSNKLKEYIKGNDELALKSKKIILILDPTVQSTLKQSIESALKLFVQGETIRGLLEGVAKFVKPQDAKSEKGQSIAESLKLENKAFIEIQPEYAMMNASQLKPTAVQQSVPAWTIFGIFFIVLPLSGSVIRERQEGTLTRLFAMPVPFATILLGKIFTYGFVNMVQLGLMLGVGVAILPLFGTPVLEMGNRPDLIVLVGLCVALAATGYGLMLGTILKSYEQAAVFGPISIVIAAALGGIMIPVFMMPGFMQPISIISPLRWGHEAFVDIFVRGADVNTLLPNITRLLVFFAGTLLIALFFFFRKE